MKGRIHHRITALPSDVDASPSLPDLEHLEIASLEQKSVPFSPHKAFDFAPPLDAPEQAGLL
jgi:hypothetical protein